MNGGESYDITIIAAAVGVVLIVILFVAIGVKVFLNRSNSKKVSVASQTSYAYNAPPPLIMSVALKISTFY